MPCINCQPAPYPTLPSAMVAAWRNSDDRRLTRACRCPACHGLPSADASNMQALLQQLLQQLHAASSPHKPHQQRATAAASPTPAAGEWQCRTAAVAAVLAEVLFGASGAWEPPLAAASLSRAGPAATGGSSQHGGAAGSSQAQAGQWQQQLGVVDAAYEGILLQAVSTVVKPRLWGLPTAQPVEAAAAAGTARPEKLPAQVRLLSCCNRTGVVWRVVVAPNLLWAIGCCHNCELLFGNSEEKVAQLCGA